MKIFLLLLLFLLPSQALEYQPDLAQKTFLRVWTKVNTTFYESSFNDTDWQSLKSTYHAKVKKAQNWQELRLILNQMLGELKLSHFGVYKNPNEVANHEPQGGTYLGIHLRLIDQTPIIYDVVKDSPAHRAGLKPGMILTAFENEPIAKLIEELELSPESSPNIRLDVTRSLLNKISTPPDGKTTLKTAHSEEIFDFKPGFYRGELGRLFDDSYPLSFETRLLKEDQHIRLISFDLFLPKIMARLNKAIAQAHEEKAKGLIIDLRGNLGGLGIMATGLIGRLIDSELDLGDMNNTSGNFPFHAFPQEGAYLGPIVVLVDSFSASTSEIFAAALQEHKRARIIGRPTAAAVLPSITETLPNGDRFQYAVGDFITAIHKTPLEGKGVTPDQLITLDPALLRAGTDPDLQAAVKWLKTQQK